MAVCILLFCTLQTVLAAVNFGLKSGNSNRLVTRDYVSLAYNIPDQLPAEDCRHSRREGHGHRHLVWRHLSRSQEFLRQPGSPAGSVPAHLSGNHAATRPEGEMAARCARRIIGRKLAERFGWKVGDSFQLESFIPPYRVGKPFDFVVDGIYDTDEAQIPGHRPIVHVLQFQVPVRSDGPAHRHRHSDFADRRSASGRRHQQGHRCNL